MPRRRHRRPEKRRRTEVMKGAIRGRESERGAMLVHVAVALLVLASFATFSFDFGLFWVSRRQAQTSADAAAMAGAIAIAYDGADASADSFAKTAAFAVSQQNLVWGEAPAVDPPTDITFPVCPDG